MELREYEVNFEGIDSSSKVHDYFSEVFEFPQWYGRNLDALYDCLTSMPPCKISLVNVEYLYRLGEYADKVLDVFRDAARDTGEIELIEVKEGK